MKQVGNLSIVCAQRSDITLKLCQGIVSVYISNGLIKNSLSAKWDDDKKINEIIHALNFEKFKNRKEPKK